MTSSPFVTCWNVHRQGQPLTNLKMMVWWTDLNGHACLMMLSIIMNDRQDNCDACMHWYRSMFTNRPVTHHFNLWCERNAPCWLMCLFQKWCRLNRTRTRTLICLRRGWGWHWRMHTFVLCSRYPAAVVCPAEKKNIMNRWQRCAKRFVKQPAILLVYKILVYHFCTCMWTIWVA